MDVRVGHLPDPNQLDVAYAGGQPAGEVEHIEFARPQPEFLRPYIQSYLRERPEVLFPTIAHLGPDSGSREAPGC